MSEFLKQEKAILDAKEALRKAELALEEDKYNAGDKPVELTITLTGNQWHRIANKLWTERHTGTLAVFNNKLRSALSEKGVKDYTK